MKTTPLILALLTASLSAVAAPVIYFGEDIGLGENSVLPVASRVNSTAARNNFVAQLTGTGTETFESFADGTDATPSLNLTFPGSSGLITATLSGSGEVNAVTAGQTQGNGRYGTSGTKYWDVDSASGSFTINFSEPVAAFGFYGIDVGDFDGVLRITRTSGIVQTIFNVGNSINVNGGGVLFWGIIDTTDLFTQIAFSNTAPGGGDVFGFDDMIIGDQRQVTGGVPEPGTYALMGLGLACIGIWKRRRS